MAGCSACGHLPLWARRQGWPCTMVAPRPKPVTLPPSFMRRSVFPESGRGLARPPLRLNAGTRHKALALFCLPGLFFTRGSPNSVGFGAFDLNLPRLERKQARGCRERLWSGVAGGSEGAPQSLFWGPGMVRKNGGQTGWWGGIGVSFQRQWGVKSSFRQQTVCCELTLGLIPVCTGIAMSERPRLHPPLGP